MSLRGIDHVQLAMPGGGEAAARGFYGELLGLPERPKPAPLAARGGCWFESDMVKIHLGVEEDFRPARKAHVAVVVDDVVVLAQRLAASGVETVEGERVEGRARLFAHDPFGNRLEFVELSPGAG